VSSEKIREEIIKEIKANLKIIIEELQDFTGTGIKVTLRYKNENIDTDHLYLEYYRRER